jgi:ArsR family transcriptional regulator, arsenate/arsenite/antimonite-responsive transcriptional repressor
MSLSTDPVVLAPTPVRSLSESYTQVMKALADPTRLEILRLVGSASDYACTSLEAELDVGKSTISYHVKILSHAGLLSVQRQGRYFRYRLNPDVLDFYVPNLLERLNADIDSSAITTTAD